jgi:hypothetical protein
MCEALVIAVNDETLINALRDHAETLERTTSPENDSFDRDIRQVEQARALASKIDKGAATTEEKGRVADMVHPSVKTRYGL